MKPLVSIQYLRALAALAVVVFHACQWADLDFDIGAGGVDVFFVISGFLMWAITQNAALTPATFLGRRIVRVAPLYWAVTLGLAGLTLAAPKLLPGVKPAASHVVLSLFFIPHLDPAGLPFPLLPPGWTLNYEAILYLIFAAALTAPRSWRFGLVLGCLGGLTVLGLLVHPLFPLFANPMMLEFAAGVILARSYGQGVRPGLILSCSLIGLGIAAFAVLRLASIHSDIGRWILWGAPALAIVAGAIGLEAAGALPRWRGLERIGDASYSIYLCHWPVVALTAHLIHPGVAWVFIPAALLASLGAGLWIRQTVEAPLIRRLSVP